jgi:hypothetical protein
MQNKTTKAKIASEKHNFSTSMFWSTEAVERKHLLNVARTRPGHLQERWAAFTQGMVDRRQRCLIHRAPPNKRGTVQKSYFQSDRSLVTVNQPKGYTKVKIVGKMVFTHNVALLLRLLRENPGIEWYPAFQNAWCDKTLEVSHLCGNPLCICGDHLELETARYQKTRDACHHFSIRNRHRCPHRPHCVLWREHGEPMVPDGEGAEPPSG